MRHFNILEIVMVIIFGTNIWSCSDSETPTGPKDLEPTGYRAAFIPMAVGNSWTYVDSLFTSSDTMTEFYTVSISDFRTDTLGTWWTFHNIRYTGSSEFMVRNDSVYNLQHNSVTWVASLEYVPPPSTDTAVFTSLFGGDASVQKSVFSITHDFSTPAGNFDSCASYTSNISNMSRVEILRAGVGIVGLDLQVIGVWHNRVRLLEYTIKH